MEETIKMLKTDYNHVFEQIWWKLVRDKKVNGLRTKTLWDGWVDDIDRPTKLGLIKRNKGWDK